MQGTKDCVKYIYFKFPAPNWSQSRKKNFKREIYLYGFSKADSCCVTLERRDDYTTDIERHSSFVFKMRLRNYYRWLMKKRVFLFTITSIAQPLELLQLLVKNFFLRFPQVTHLQKNYAPKFISREKNKQMICRNDTVLEAVYELRKVSTSICPDRNTSAISSLFSSAEAAACCRLACGKQIMLTGYKTACHKRFKKSKLASILLGK